MNIELSLIRLFMKRENYDKYGSLIYSIKSEPEIDKILLTINSYYEEYTHHLYISVDELETYFFFRYPSEKNNTLYAELFTRVRTLEVSDSLAADIVLRYKARDVAGKVMETLLPTIQGEDHAGLLQLPALIEEYKRTALVMDEEQSPFIEDTIEELVALTANTNGLRWRLDCMNTNIGPLPGRTLGHVFARVESGKTTFLSSEVTNFARQLGEGENILWICNEEDGRRVKYRTFQSMLEESKDVLGAKVAAGRGSELWERYKTGHGDRIHFRYDPSITTEDITALLEKFPTRLLLIDIADHVRFRGDGELSGPARLGELYRRFRSMAVNYDCDVITVGQASAESEGRAGVHLDHMHNSKTDKPGALDYAIGIGRTYDDAEKDVRFINIVKNKIGMTIEERTPVLIDIPRGLFLNMGG